MTPTHPDADRVIARTRRWIETIVIGLDLCPFAKSSVEAGGLRIEVTDADGPLALREAIVAEMRHLQSRAGAHLDSTLLVHPDALADFLEFNDFLDVAQDALWAESLDGEIQIASFHPDYRFANSGPDDIGDYTNRSPHPMLHLLRESSVARAVDAHTDPEGIPARNVERLRTLGTERLRELLG